MSETKSVTIVGAGFSGLTSAYYLARVGYEVEVFEAASAPGGLIQTLQTPHGLVETAANAVLNSALVEDMAKTLNLAFLKTKSEAKKRFIWVGGRARRWPLGTTGTLGLLRGVSLFAFNRQRARPLAAETVASWVERVFGLEAARFLIEAALQGVYAGDPAKLSASVIFRRFFEKREKVRGRKVRSESVAPREGMAAWTKALEQSLSQSGVQIHYAKPYTVSMMASDVQKKNHSVVIATGPMQAARLLESIDPEKASALRQIELLPLVSVTAFFKSTDEKTEGFGVLFPPCENRRVLGVLKNDFIFENRSSGLHSETWIAGGALHKDVIHRSDSELMAMIKAERASVFELNDEPASFYITRWPEALPHYTTELESRLPLLNEASKNVVLAGNYLGDLGLAKLLEHASKLPERLR